jgi:hypothetical protein
MSITRRVPSSVSQGSTPRITHYDPAVTVLFDLWARRWSGSWGNCWTVRQSSFNAAILPDVTLRLRETVALDATARVAGAPAGHQTSRLHFLLALEGDQDGDLLLEGDEQSGDDVLALEGDATSVTAHITRRVA